MSVCVCLCLSALQLGLQILCEGLRHPNAAEVPAESEEPGHGRLPPQQATLLLGVAQLSPVSLMSCHRCPPHHHRSGSPASFALTGPRVDFT